MFAAITRWWSEVQAGHFKVAWLVGAGLSAAAGLGYRPAWAISAFALAAFGAIYLEGSERRRFGIDFVAGMAAAGVAVFALAAGSDLELEAFSTAALLGTVTNAMLLGHWHLNQPRLGTKPIERLVWMMWAAIAIFIATTALLVTDNTDMGLVGAWTAIAFASFTSVLTAMVHHLVRTRSIMSATGILYLAILLCFVAAFTGSLSALAHR